MSRLYFHSPTRTAELRGSERAWMGGLCNDIALGVLDLRWHDKALDGLVTEPSLQRGPYHDEHLRWVSNMETSLKVGFRDDLLTWKGKRLEAFSLILNTACAVGSNAVKLAARLHGQCELHAWVDGPNRVWLADLMQAGLDAGVFRTGFYFADVPDGPKDKWSSQGWDDVITLLRERDDEPVVTSYSVCDRFPNSTVANWTPPSMPEGWRPDWYDEDDWAGKAPEDREEYYFEQAHDLWYDIPDDEQWRQAMEGLRADTKSGLEMKPDNWQTFRFRHELTFLDLIAGDRDARLDEALGFTEETVDA